MLLVYSIFGIATLLLVRVLKAETCANLLSIAVGYISPNAAGLPWATRHFVFCAGDPGGVHSACAMSVSTLTVITGRLIRNQEET